MKVELLIEPKVELLIEPYVGFHAGPRPRPRPIRRSLPWYQTKYGRCGQPGYVHRVRSGLLHSRPSWRGGKSLHMSFRLWCGTQGSGFHGHLLAEVPDNAVVCATCEGRALGAGMPSAVLVANRPIRFSPRLAS